MTLEIKDLHVEFEGKEILRGINLTLQPGKIHALMGPNGSGKSTLSYVLMGNPKYKVTKGTIKFNGKVINKLNTSERAKLGIFLSFQNPTEFYGITISNFLRQAYNSLHKEKLSFLEFKELMEKNADKLKIDKKFLFRYLNQGFSGGEKKKAEILQLLVLNPRFAILDETDSGLDIDSLKLVSNGIKNFMKKDKYILIITHYKRILKYVKPERVSIMLNGKIVLSGKNDIVNKLESKGYGWISEN